MYKVSESSIHGMGLFASERIEEGTTIGYVVGVPVEEDGPHVLWLDDDGPGIRVTNEMRFINHSDNPSAIYYDDLTVVALRDIGVGEEITHNYDPNGEDMFETGSNEELVALEPVVRVDAVREGGVLEGGVDHAA